MATVDLTVCICSLFLLVCRTGVEGTESGRLYSSSADSCIRGSLLVLEMLGRAIKKFPGKTVS